MKILFIPSELIYPTDRIAGPTLWRLEEGLRIWQAGGHNSMVVSGGIFLPRDVQTQPAATLMKQWLVAKGVPERLVIAENDSVDSFENITFTRSQLERRRIELRRPGDAIWTLVSHKTHLRRLLITCRALQIQAVGHPVDYQVSFMARVGEAVGRLVHWWDPRGTKWLARRNQRKRRDLAWRPKSLLAPR